MVTGRKELVLVMLSQPIRVLHVGIVVHHHHLAHVLEIQHNGNVHIVNKHFHPTQPHLVLQDPGKSAMFVLGTGTVALAQQHQIMGTQFQPIMLLIPTPIRT